MSYLKFMIKKLTNNRYNIVVLILILLMVGAVLYFNVNAKKYLGHLEQLESSLAERKEKLAEFTNEIQSKEKGGEEYSLIQENIDFTKQLIEQDETNIKLYKQGKWSESYSYQLDRMKMDKEIVSKNSQNYGNDLLPAIEREIKLFEYLKDKNLEKDTYRAVQGINFTTEYWHYVLPVSVTFLFIFLLSNTYTERFKEKMDISLLYPYRRSQIIFQDICLGVLVSFSLFVVSIFFAFVFSSLISGIGSFEYPYNYFSSDGTLSFVSVSAVLFPAMLMQMLVFVICVMWIYVVALLIKNQLTTLLIALLMILGSYLVVNIAVPFHKIAQFIPFTYINAIGVVSGEFAHSIHNYHLTFEYGMIILMIYFVLILGLIWILEQINKTMK
ncbi:hypothetical protein KBI51_03730 [Aerococcaceae bacterium zg-ZUI334]|uniref:hypothetical protein n=1 Tax=Aerococcaceae bacterium zg-252 TaxID=2796928 RepID=UPI001B9AF816|nr:hypothetical protein [Aerococcaceae bacterium zg-ZUI334]